MKKLKKVTPKRKAVKKIIDPPAMEMTPAKPSVCKTLARKAEKAVEDLEDKCARGGCGHVRRMHIFNRVSEECHLCPCRDFIELK